MLFFAAAWEIVKMVLMVVARYHRFKKFSQKLCHLWDNHNHHLSHITNTITIRQSKWPSQPHHTTPRPLHPHSWIRAPWHSLLRAYAPSKHAHAHAVVVFLPAVEFVWKSIWLNLQEVSTCHMVFTDNCASTNQNSNYLVWVWLKAADSKFSLAIASF